LSAKGVEGGRNLAKKGDSMALFAVGKTQRCAELRCNRAV
jgi:hypothetical protein